MTRVLLALLFLATTAHAAPLCLPIATAAALTHLGTPTSAEMLARELPVHADGVDLFDLRLWLADHGRTALVVKPDEDVIRQCVLAGAAVVVVRDEPEGRHAVALLSGDATYATFVDSRAAQPTLTRWSAALGRARAAIVIWRPDGAPKRGISQQLWQEMLRIDAEFVATGWLLRADELPGASTAKFALLARAVQAAPCNKAARTALAETQSRLPVTPWTRKTEAGLAACELPEK